MEVSVTERYALLQRQVRVTLFTTSLEARNHILHPRLAQPTVEVGLLLGLGVGDPRLQDVERDLEPVGLRDALDDRHLGPDLEYATLSHQAREGIDKAVSDALNAEGDAWQREQDSADEQDETPTREDQS